MDFPSRKLSGLREGIKTPLPGKRKNPPFISPLELKGGTRGVGF